MQNEVCVRSTTRQKSCMHLNEDGKRTQTQLSVSGPLTVDIFFFSLKILTNVSITFFV